MTIILWLLKCSSTNHIHLYTVVITQYLFLYWNKRDVLLYAYCIILIGILYTSCICRKQEETTYLLIINYYKIFYLFSYPSHAYTLYNTHNILYYKIYTAISDHTLIHCFNKIIESFYHAILDHLSTSSWIVLFFFNSHNFIIILTILLCYIPTRYLAIGFIHTIISRIFEIFGQCPVPIRTTCNLNFIILCFSNKEIRNISSLVIVWIIFL